MVGSETMLGICKNNVLGIVFHGLAEYYMFNQHAADGCDGYRAIIGWCGSVAFLWIEEMSVNLQSDASDGTRPVSNDC